jgi:hypothetical protein
VPVSVAHDVPADSASSLTPCVPPLAPPPFTLSDLVKAIPPRCFERSLVKGLLYLARDLVMIAVLVRDNSSCMGAVVVVFVLVFTGWRTHVCLCTLSSPFSVMAAGLGCLHVAHQLIAVLGSFPAVAGVLVRTTRSRVVALACTPIKWCAQSCGEQSAGDMCCGFDLGEVVLWRDDMTRLDPPGTSKAV